VSEEELNSSVVANTLAVARDLEAAGLTKSQAESIAEKLMEVMQSKNDDLVTKDYLKAELTDATRELESEMAALETRLIRWIIGLQFTTMIFIFGFFYFWLKQ